jgi:uncharacterized RDD family membrane protein YckC
MDDAAAAGAPKNTPDSASPSGSDSAAAGAPAPRIARSGPPPPKGRPGLAWDGSGNLGRLSPQAKVRAAPVPRAADSPAPPPSEPARRAPAPRGAAATARGDLALDLRRGGAVASFGRRAIGFVADELTVQVVVWVLLIAIDADVGALITLRFVVSLGYRWLFDSLGWSPGKLATGLRLVNAQGRPPGPFGGGVRALVALLIPFYISYLWAAWDPRVQTLHDKAARTYVVPLSALTERERPARP